MTRNSLGVDKNMIADGLEVNFVHSMIRYSLVVDKNLIADDLEVNFVHPGNSKETEIKLKISLGH